MTITTIDGRTVSLDDLESAAQAATPGPRQAFLADTGSDPVFGRREAVISHKRNESGAALGRMVVWPGDIGNEDAVQMAAFDRETCLALISEIRRLRRAVDAARDATLTLAQEPQTGITR